jgi:hypothetical protein
MFRTETPLEVRKEKSYIYILNKLNNDNKITLPIRVQLFYFLGIFFPISILIF